MAGSSAFGSAPSPAQPLDYASRRGEVRSTPAGLVTWDGSDWVPLGLPVSGLFTLPSGLLVVGGATADTLHVTGNATIDGVLSAPKLVQPRNLSTFVTSVTTAQITSSHDTAIPYEDHSADTLGFYDGSHTSRFVCPTGADGLYLFLTSVWWANGAVGTGTTERSIWHRVTRASTDGHTSRYSSQNGLYAESRPALQTVMSLIGMAATDYVEAMAFQTSSASLGFTNSGSNRTLVFRMSD